MVFNRFTYLLLVRLAIISCLMMAFAFIFGRTDLFFTQVLIGLVVVVLLFELLRFINVTNRNLSRFLLAAKEQDFTATFPDENLSRLFSDLNKNYSDVLEQLKHAKLEREAQYQYLKKIVNHIDLGIISLNHKEEIELINEMATEILAIPAVKSWQLLKHSNTDFFELIKDLPPNAHRLIELKINGAQRQLSLNTSSLTLLGDKYQIITFKDIRSDITQKEIEAWHKLIRILTHEIMNSVTPIASMTETLHNIVADDGKARKARSLDDQAIEDLANSLTTINHRAEGLLKFVSDYRKLSNVAHPQVQVIDTAQFLNQLELLFKGSIQEKNIRLVFESNVAEITADDALLDQVLINLIKNAIEAIPDQKGGLIKISVSADDKENIISVTDSGPGISADQLEKVFIPFFSTKTQGSGIGLSLSRQIISLHGGSLDLKSNPDAGATFQIRLPK